MLLISFRQLIKYFLDYVKSLWKMHPKIAFKVFAQPSGSETVASPAQNKCKNNPLSIWKFKIYFWYNQFSFCIWSHHRQSLVDILQKRVLRCFLQLWAKFERTLPQTSPWKKVRNYFFLNRLKSLPSC